MKERRVCSKCKNKRRIWFSGIMNDKQVQFCKECSIETLME